MTALSFVWVHPYSQNSGCDTISNGLSLFSVAFPNLTALLTSLLVISILQMFLHSPTIFWISSSLLVSGSGLSDSGSVKTYILL